MTFVLRPRVLLGLSSLWLLSAAPALAAKPAAHKPDAGVWIPANGPRTFIGLAGEKTSPELAWKGAARTDHYEIVLATDPEMTAKVSTQQVTATRAVFKDLPPGRYYAKVSAFDGRGEVRQSSPVRVLDVFVVSASGARIWGNGFRGPSPMELTVAGPPTQVVVDGAVVQAPVVFKKPGERTVRISPKERLTVARTLRISVLPPAPGAQPEASAQAAAASPAATSTVASAATPAASTPAAPAAGTEPTPDAEPLVAAGSGPAQEAPAAPAASPTTTASPATTASPTTAASPAPQPATAPSAAEAGSDIEPLVPGAAPRPSAAAAAPPAVAVAEPVAPPAAGATEVAPPPSRPSGQSPTADDEASGQSGPVAHLEQKPLPPADPKLTPAPLFPFTFQGSALPLGFVQRGLSVELGALGAIDDSATPRLGGRLGLSLRAGIGDNVEAIASLATGTDLTGVATTTTGTTTPAAAAATQSPIADVGLKYLAHLGTLNGGVALEEQFITGGASAGLRFRPSLVGGADLGILAVSTTHGVSVGTDGVLAYEGALQVWVFPLPWLSVSAAGQVGQSFVQDAPLALGAALGLRARSDAFEFGLSGQAGIGSGGSATFGKYGGLFSVTYRR